MQPEYPSISRN